MNNVLMNVHRSHRLCYEEPKRREHVSKRFDELSCSRRCSSSASHENCLTNALWAVYDGLQYCLRLIYALFLHALWQVLTPDTVQDYHDRGDTKTIDVTSVNNSAGEKYRAFERRRTSEEKLETGNRRRVRPSVPKSNSQHSR